MTVSMSRFQKYIPVSVYRLFFSNTVIFEYPYSKKYSYSDFLGPNIRDFSDIRTVEYPMFEYSIRMVESSILSLKLHSNKVVTTSFLFFCVFPVSYAVLRAMIGPNIRDFSDIRTVEYPMFEYSIRIVECSILSLKLHLNKVVTTSFLFFVLFLPVAFYHMQPANFIHLGSQLRGESYIASSGFEYPP